MAQQYLTLEEAAQRLGMSADALREMAKKKEIRAFQDRGNWRFKASDIEEEARRRGADSAPELALSEGKTVRTSSDADVHLALDDHLSLSDDSEVQFDVPKPGVRPADSGVRLDRGSDSDVKLVEESKSPSDSDIRLHDAAKGNPGSSANIITEEIDLDAEEAKLQAKAAKSPKPRAQTTQYNPNMPVLPTTSPYEISEPDVDLSKIKTKNVQDGSSEHEMIAFDPDKVRDELGSGEIPLLPSDEEVDFGGVPAPNAGNSGINLKDAVDSGISLEEGGSDELAFELSLDKESTPKPEAKSAKASKKAADPQTPEDSSSEFELSLDEDSSMDPSSSSEFELSLDSGPDLALESSDSEFELTLDEDSVARDDSDEAKDIFEETNLELEPLGEESGSEVVSLDQDTDLEESEFDIDLEQIDEESASQVVSLDEEEADDAAATIAQKRSGTPGKAKAGKAKAVAEDEPELDFGEFEEDEQPQKKPAKKKSAVADLDEEDLDDLEDLRSAAAPAASADWGPVPAIFLFPTFIVLFLVGIMSFELIQGMWGYHRSTKVGKPIIDNIARLFDDKIPKD